MLPEIGGQLSIAARSGTFTFATAPVPQSDLYVQRTLSVPAATFNKYLTTITLDESNPSTSIESITYEVPSVACNTLPTNDQLNEVARAAVAVELISAGTE